MEDSGVRELIYVALKMVVVAAARVAIIQVKTFVTQDFPCEAEDACARAESLLGLEGLRFFTASNLTMSW